MRHRSIDRATRSTQVPDWLNGLGVWQLAVVLISLSLTWGFIAIDLNRSRNVLLVGSAREAAHLVQGLAETAVVSVDMLDQTLKSVREARARDPGFDLNAWARLHAAGGGPAQQIAVADRLGRVVASTTGPVGQINIADREYFRVHVAPGPDQLFIGRPVVGRMTHRRAINLSRRLLDASGQFEGVVVVSAEMSFLGDFQASLSAAGGVVMLIGAQDGIVRAAAPEEPDLLDRRLPGADRLLGGAQTGSMRQAGVLDAADRIISWRRLAHYPLMVAIGVDVRQVLVPFWHEVVRRAAIGGVLSIVIASVGVLLARQRRRLLASRAMLAATLENMSQGIMMIDPGGRVRVINHRAVELLGLPPGLAREDILFRDILRHQMATQEFGPAEQLPASFTDMLEAGGLDPTWARYDRVRPNGTVLDVVTVLLPSGGAVRTYTDITEQRRNELALAAARDAAEAGGRARAEFLAIMSHEIRTPLNGILGVTDLLSLQDLPAQSRDYLRVVSDSGAHLVQLLNDILDFSSLESGQVALEESDFDPARLAGDAVRLLSHAAGAKQIELSLDVDADVPCSVLGDARRLRQVLLNLIDNAVKFTPSGAVSVWMHVISRDETSVRLGVRVRDTGIGIAPEAQRRLFLPFAQVDREASRRFGGTGLGLAISRRLVERMGGAIAVHSEYSGGSTFSLDVMLRLPVSGQPSAPSDVPCDAMARLRILLVEDNATNRLVATRMLETLGHEVEAVADGRAAVEAVQAGGHDAVLMDVIMPEMDGLQATREIRMLGKFGDIAIIGLTASVSAEDEAACLAAGMDGFLSKPVTRAGLEDALRAALGPAEQAAALT